MVCCVVSSGTASVIDLSETGSLMLGRPELANSQTLFFFAQGPHIGFTSSHFKCRFRHVMLHLSLKKIPRHDLGEGTYHPLVVRRPRPRDFRMRGVLCGDRELIVSVASDYALLALRWSRAECLLQQCGRPRLGGWNDGTSHTKPRSATLGSTFVSCP